MIIQGLVFLGLSWGVGYADALDKVKITESIQSQLKLLEQMPEKDLKAERKLNQVANHQKKQSDQQEVKKLSAEIWSEQKENKTSIIVQFENGLPYPALFKRGDYIYLAISFPTDISRKKWSDTVAPEITALEILPTEDATLVRKIDHVYPQLRIDSKQNQFIIEFVSL